MNERPPHGFLDAIIQRAPAETRMEGARENVVWQYGVRLLNTGYFWESHEVLEPVWAGAAPNSRERFLVQAVIHLANGALKLRMGRAKAAGRLAGLAEECLERAFGPNETRLMGIDRAEALAAARHIRKGEPSIRLRLDDAL